MAHRAWLVDFDGTLYQPKPVKLCMAAELLFLGWTALPTLRRFRKAHEQLREGQLASHAALGQAPSSPFEQQLAVTAADLNKQPSQVRQIVEQWMMQRPRKWIRLFRRRRLIAELQAFQLRGGKLALVSDYPLRTKMQALSNDLTFEAIIASGEAGGPTQLKPAPDGYLAAATALGVPPNACLVIGDRLDADGQAAHAAGMAFRHIK